MEMKKKWKEENWKFIQRENERKITRNKIEIKTEKKIN